MHAQASAVGLDMIHKNYHLLLQASVQAMLWLYGAVFFLYVVYRVVSMYAAKGAVAYNRRQVAVFGLLVPCIWCPIFLGLWDRHSQQLRHRWGQVGVTEVPLPSPFFSTRKAKQSPCTQLFQRAGFLLLIFAAFLLVGLLSFVQLEYEVLTQITPLCVSRAEHWLSGIVLSTSLNTSWMLANVVAEFFFFQQGVGRVDRPRCV